MHTPPGVDRRPENTRPRCPSRLAAHGRSGLPVALLLELPVLLDEVSAAEDGAGARPELPVTQAREGPAGHPLPSGKCCDPIEFRMHPPANVQRLPDACSISQPGLLANYAAPTRESVASRIKGPRQCLRERSLSRGGSALARQPFLNLPCPF